MTKAELSQYRSIKNKIMRNERRMRENTLRDSVRGSDREFPYTEHIVSVEGLAGTGDNLRLVRQTEELRRRLRCIEDFVESIDDFTMQLICMYRYIDGDTCPTWAQITRKIYPRLAVDRLERMKWSIEKKHDRYFRKEKTT